MTIDMGDLALLVLAALCLLVFVCLLTKVLKGQTIRIDELGYLLFVERLRSPALSVVMTGVSNLASWPCIVAVLVVAFIWVPCRFWVICAAVNVGAISVVDQLLKVLVRRPRPQGFRLVEARGLSFPSGHSMAAMAFYGYGIWLVRSGVCGISPSVVVFGIALACVILAIGVSRIYLGVHYASDVLGGFCLAFVWLVLFVRLGVWILAV